ncbi:DNA-directed RNA polymerase [Candidatus Woesearchaeota archaeon]|nr:DNA-directed RNA polymerase [Candidatus Woesearchaeota archaeon]
MFYRTEISDHIRVSPRLFNLEINEAILRAVKQKYDGLIDPAMGVVIDVSSVKNIGEGIIIPGDGASYYETTFELLLFQPELHEVLTGKIKDIADFGAFITLGPIDGMIHISQTMDDFVTFAKDKTLSGRDSKRALRVGDACRARVIAVSFKDVTNPKIGLTMRQPGLGRLDWIAAEDAQATEPKEDKKDDKKEKKKKSL